MKQLIFFLVIMTLNITALAQQTGPAGSVLRVPAAGGSAKMGALDLSSANATTNTLNATTKLSGLTAGSCLFGGAGGGLLQPATSACFWDSVNSAFGIGTATPSTKAALEVASTTKGVLFPRMTSAQKAAITSPVNGLILYDTDLNRLESYSTSTSAWGPVGRLQGTAAALNSSAAFQVDSTSRGTLPAPRMTGSQRDAITTPATGLQVYNTDTNQLNVYNGSAWQAVGAGGGGGGGVNVLQNSNYDAEQGTGLWTASGGAFTAPNTNPWNGNQSFSWTASAVSQTLDSALIAVPAGFTGRKCQVNIPFYSYNGATNDYRVRVLDGSSNVLSDGPINNTLSAASTAPYFATFDCPTTPASVKFRLISMVASPSALKFDDVFLGQDRSFVSAGAWLTEWKTYPATFGGLGTVTGSSVQSRRVGDTLEISGSFVVGTPSASPATISLGYNGVNLGLSIDSSKLTQTTLVGHVAQSGFNSTYFTTEILGLAGATALNIGIQTASQSASIPLNGNAIFGSGVSVGFFARVPITGWVADKLPVEGNNYETTGWRVDANIAGGNPSLGVAAVSTYAGIEDPSLTLTNNVGGLTAMIPCSGTNAATGSTCSAGNESVGITVPIPTNGDVEACASFSWGGNPGSGGALTATFQVVETPNNAQTISQEGNERISTTYGNNTLTQESAKKICGIFRFGSAGTKTFRLMYEQAFSGSPANSYLLGDANASVGQRDIHWTIRPYTANAPAPVFADITQAKIDITNRIKTFGPNMRIESANISCGSGGPTATQYYAWVNAIGYASAGRCLVYWVPGTFSAAPFCVTTVLNGGAGNGYVATNSSNTSYVNVAVANGGTPADAALTLTCYGPF